MGRSLTDLIRLHAQRPSSVQEWSVVGHVRSQIHALAPSRDVRAWDAAGVGSHSRQLIHTFRIWNGIPTSRGSVPSSVAREFASFRYRAERSGGPAVALAKAGGSSVVRVSPAGNRQFRVIRVIRGLIDRVIRGPSYRGGGRALWFGALNKGLGEDARARWASQLPDTQAHAATGTRRASGLCSSLRARGDG